MSEQVNYNPEQEPTNQRQLEMQAIQEKALRISFIDLFRNRLNSHPADLSRFAWFIEQEDLKQLGIQEVTKIIPALYFTLRITEKDEEIHNYSFGPPNLWIESNPITEAEYPHWELENSLGEYIESVDPQLIAQLNSAYIIVQGSGQISLLIDDFAAKYLDIELEHALDVSFSENPMVSLSDRYHINNIVGGKDFTCGGGELKKVVSLDMLGAIRKNNHLLRFAKAKGMTNTQYARFLALVDSIEKAQENLPNDHEPTIEEIMKAEQNIPYDGLAAAAMASNTDSSDII